ncbi:response regulator [Kamptonema formosum]|uniref:response regulator n=1 Tax=Kamptonema formosum TaxID=331992 RepID=UPI00034B3B44|nr:response regulator [Oscillatoria sp. PCC 10802]
MSENLAKTIADSAPVAILLIEDNLEDAELIQEILGYTASAQFEVTHVKQVSQALQLLAEECFNVILLGIDLGECQELDTVAQLQRAAPTLPVVVLVDSDDQQIAAEALRKGAQDYLVKGEVDCRLLVRALRYAVERKHLEVAILQAFKHEREFQELKERWLSLVSHKFRNPLTTIVASADLLEECSDHLTEEKKHDLYRRIQSASQRMNELLEDFLLTGTTESPQDFFNPDR